jgi:hypothetical protein
MILVGCHIEPRIASGSLLGGFGLHDPCHNDAAANRLFPELYEENNNEKKKGFHGQ